MFNSSLRILSYLLYSFFISIITLFFNLQLCHAQVTIISAPTEGYIYPLEIGPNQNNYGLGEFVVQNNSSKTEIVEAMVYTNNFSETHSYTIVPGMHTLEFQIPINASHPFEGYSLRISTTSEELIIDQLSAGTHAASIGHSLMSGAGNDSLIIQEKVWVPYIEQGIWKYIAGQSHDPNAPGYLGGNALLIAMSAAEDLGRRILFENAAVSGSLVGDGTNQVQALSLIPDFFPEWILTWTGGNDLRLSLGVLSKEELETALSADFNALHDKISLHYPQAFQLYVADYFPSGEHLSGLQGVDRSGIVAKVVKQLSIDKGIHTRFVSSTSLHKLDSDFVHWEANAIHTFAQRISQVLKAYEENDVPSLEPLKIEAASWEATGAYAKITVSEGVEFKGGIPDRAFYGRVNGNTLLAPTSISLINPTEIRVYFSSQPDEIIFTGQNILNPQGNTPYPVPTIVSGLKGLTPTWWTLLDFVFPITVQSFEVHHQSLHWVLNASHVDESAILQRSYDNQVFENLMNLHFVNGQSIGFYTEKDPRVSKTFYRFKFIDQNGTVSYSERKVLQATLENHIQFGPNPVQSGKELIFSEPIYLSIFDISGKRMYHSTQKIRRYLLTQEAGIYVIRINGQKSKKIVVQ